MGIEYATGSSYKTTSSLHPVYSSSHLSKVWILIKGKQMLRECKSRTFEANDNENTKFKYFDYSLLM